MKYFFLYIILLFCFIISMAYYNTFINVNSKEPFVNNKKNKKENNKENNKEKKIIILLGDSVLKNNYYAKNNQSIEEILYKKNKNTYCYAADDSLIEDISSQINSIPEYLNTQNTFIFLSAGGNNILNHLNHDKNDKNETNYLDSIFSSYEKLIEQIQKKMNKSNIILLDIYYPKSEKYKKFHSIIAEWNNMIYNYANNPNNDIYDVLKISNIIIEDDDLSHQIEPSTKGGEKIANAIIKTQ